MSGMEDGRVKKAYHMLVLAYEQHISQGMTIEGRKVRLPAIQRQHPAVAPAPFVVFCCRLRTDSTAT